MSIAALFRRLFSSRSAERRPKRPVPQVSFAGTRTMPQGRARPRVPPGEPPLAKIAHAPPAVVPLPTTPKLVEGRRADPARDTPERGARSAAAVDAFVGSVRRLPLFTGTATRLLRSVGQEHVTARELTQLISTDVALVAHLLRIVNSPFYGLTRGVSTVADALSVLGIDHLRRLVMAAVLQRPSSDQLVDSRAIRGFWHHELVCASLARFLAFRSNVDAELAYMAGLMHDVGRLAMLMHFPQHGDTLLRMRGDADEAFGIDREHAIFDFDHAAVGGALLEQWELPAGIVRAAREHVSATEPPDAMSACVWRANLLANEMIDEPDTEDVERPWMVGIGMSVKTRRKMLDEIRVTQVGQR